MANDDYKIEDATAVLRQTHARLLAHEHRSDQAGAATKLLDAVQKALEESGWCPIRHPDGQVAVSRTRPRANAIYAVLFFNEAQAMLTLTGDDQPVELPLVYDPVAKLFVGTELEPFAQPGKPPERRNAVTVVAEKISEILSK